MSKNEQKVSWKLGLAYGLPNFGMAIMLGPVLGILSGYYPKQFGLDLAKVGGIMLLCRLFDAITDPTVGMLSDRFRDRFWGRRSWVVAGTLLLLVAMWQLLTANDPGVVTALFFGSWWMVVTLAWTVSEIPYLAWGTEITHDYDTRSKLFSYKAAIGYVGCGIFLGMPIILWAYDKFVRGLDVAGFSLDYTPRTMLVSAVMLLILMPLFLIAALAVCPDGSYIQKKEGKGIGETFRVLARSKAMILFTGGFVILGIAGGMQTTVAYLHVSKYLALEDYTSIIYVTGFIFSLIGVPIWHRIATRKGKHISFVIGLSISAALFVVLGMMKPDEIAIQRQQAKEAAKAAVEQAVVVDSAVAAVPAGEGAVEDAEVVVILKGEIPFIFWVYLIFFAACNFSQVVYFSMPPAIIGDIADASMLETRKDESGTYYSIYTFFYKAALGLGAGLAGVLLGAVFNFDPKAGMQQTPGAIMGIKVVMGYLPAVLTVIAVFVILRFPITKEKHAEIQRKLRELGLKDETIGESAG